MPAQKMAAAPAGSAVYVQIASLRSPKEAHDMATRIATEQADTLGAVGTRVTPVVLGNMGTFYVVNVGPVASAAAGEGLCKKLQSNGVDCFLATP